MTEHPEGRGTLPAGALDRGSPLEAAREDNRGGAASRETPGSAVPGRVVHCKREAFDVYIGRPGPFGNPWRVMGEASRDDALAKFEAYARDAIAHSPKFADAVRGLYGKTLGCWCAPKACHGDVLLRLAAELRLLDTTGAAK